MFESLGDRLQGVFDSLRGRGRLTEAEVKVALREVRVALLEADVNLEVARDFTRRVQDKAVGSDTLLSLQPDQRVIAIVHDELVELLGGKAAQPSLRDTNTWMLLGLQGAGKTTTAGKLAYKYKSQGRRPLLVAADTQRPAAREQLRVLGDQIGVPVLAVEDGETGLLVPPRDPVRLAAALERLLVDPELRHRLGSNGRDRVREQFDLEACRQAHVAVYRRELVSRGLATPSPKRRRR